MSNIVNYFEIGTPDIKTAMEFYSSLFGWTFGEPSEQNYRMINGGEGGLWDTSKMGGDKWAIFYVLVDDVNEAVKQAEVRGARIAIPIVSSPVIEFAHLIDKDGNRFGVWKPKP